MHVSNRWLDLCSSASVLLSYFCKTLAFFLCLSSSYSLIFSLSVHLSFAISQLFSISSSRARAPSLQPRRAAHAERPTRCSCLESPSRSRRREHKGRTIIPSHRRYIKALALTLCVRKPLQGATKGLDGSCTFSWSIGANSSAASPLAGRSMPPQDPRGLNRCRNSL